MLMTTELQFSKNQQLNDVAMTAIAHYFTEGHVAAQPYSSLDVSQRGEIVQVSYRFRDSLVNAESKLGIARSRESLS